MSSNNLAINCPDLEEFTDIEVAEKDSIHETSASFISEAEPTNETHLQTISNIVKIP